MRILIYK